MKQFSIILILFVVFLIPFTAALDLSDYPEMFSDHGVFDALIVVEKQAPVEERVAAINVMAGLNEFGKLDDVIVSSVNSPKDKNIISIGSPCTNKVSAMIYSEPEVCNSMLNEGQGRIELFENNGHYQLVVMGWTPKDTLIVSKLLQDYKQYALNGNSVGIDVNAAKTDVLSDDNVGIDVNAAKTDVLKPAMCIDDDGLCPAECTMEIDNDCPECNNDSDCNDTHASTKDVCVGSPKQCRFIQITECISGDGFCPGSCNFTMDKDCHECMLPEHCNDDDACTEDFCKGNPKRCVHNYYSGCSYNGTCYKLGNRTSQKYCSRESVFKELIPDNGACEKDFQCENFNCKENKCHVPGVFERILSWLGGLFNS